MLRGRQAWQQIQSEGASDTQSRLFGTIGAASAHTMVSTVAQEGMRRG